jgi:hypothetical protein
MITSTAEKIWICNKYRDKLDDWQKNFVGRLMERIHIYGSATNISKKETMKINEIFDILSKLPGEFIRPQRAWLWSLGISK